MNISRRISRPIIYSDAAQTGKFEVKMSHYFMAHIREWLLWTIMLHMTISITTAGFVEQGCHDSCACIHGRPAVLACWPDGFGR